MVLNDSYIRDSEPS